MDSIGKAAMFLPKVRSALRPLYVSLPLDVVVVLSCESYDGAMPIAPVPSVSAPVAYLHLAVGPAVMHGDACLCFAFQQILAAAIVAVDAASRAMRGPL